MPCCCYCLKIPIKRTGYGWNVVKQQQQYCDGKQNNAKDEGISWLLPLSSGDCIIYIVACISAAVLVMSYQLIHLMFGVVVAVAYLYRTSSISYLLLLIALPMTMTMTMTMNDRIDSTILLLWYLVCGETYERNGLGNVTYVMWRMLSDKQEKTTLRYVL